MKVLTKIGFLSLAGLLILGLTNCSGNVNPTPVSEVSHSTTITTPPTESTSVSSEGLHTLIDLTAIPIGDGKTTTTVPTDKGYLYVCKIMTGGGGAFSSPWAGTTTWDSTKKVKVDGQNFFSNASNSFTTHSGVRTITTNGLPSGYPAGNFPVSSSDDAYNYDRNPNTVTAGTVNINVPLNPVIAGGPSCTEMGAIGYAVDGVAIFNAVDGENRDAVAHEVQDECDGHPEKTGTYHYHNGSSCLVAKAPNGEATLIGYALDGFGIYVEKDSEGNLKTNGDLDVCHGVSSKVLWNGMEQTVYHYSVTVEFPYTVGCFMGSPVRTSIQGSSGVQSAPGGLQPKQPPQGQQGPPQGPLPKP